MSAEDEIRAVLATQSTAWSHGDLDGFVASLARDVRYVTPQGLVVGRDVLQQRYGEAFSAQNGHGGSAMGNLAVEVDHIHVIGDAAFVIIRWTLSDSLADRGGYALLGFIRKDHRWELGYDATLTA